MIVIVTPTTLDILNNLPSDITVLDCSKLKLKKLPNLFHLSQLKILYCHNNYLKELPTLPPNIEKLYCFNNKIKHLNCLLFATKIKIIHCQQNNIKDIPDFRLLPQLRIFNGACNNFDSRIVDVMTTSNISFREKVNYLELNNLFDHPLPHKNRHFIVNFIRNILLDIFPELPTRQQVL
jgi:Leucine-rich repeat (LRR) protein